MVREIPIEVIATWPPGNFVDPVRRGPGLVVLAAVLIAIVAILVLLRLYVHTFILRWISWDDVFILLAFISTCGMTTCTVVAYKHYGWDRHIWDTPFSKFSRALYLAWWAKIVYSTASCFTRLSLLCFYYRLTQESTKRSFRRCIQIAAVFSVLCGIMLISLAIFQCKPVRAFWTFPPLPNQKCLDDGKLTLGGGITNTFADLVVVLLPIPLILGLELPLRQRIGAIILVSLGLIVCVAGAVRAYYSWYALLATYDDTWNGFGIYIAATVELDLGVICACIPALRAFVVRVLQPRFAALASTVSHGSSKNDKKEAQTADGSAPRRRDIEEMEMAATYAFRLPSINRKVTLEKDKKLPAPHFNATKPLPPPPSDAQVLRANFRRTQLLLFKPRPLSESRKRTTPRTTPFNDIGLDMALRRKTLTPKVARTPPQNRYSSIENYSEEGSIIDLDESVGSLSTPMSATESIVGPLPSFPQSPASAIQSTRKRSDTLRIPDRTLKLSRGALFGSTMELGSNGWNPIRTRSLSDTSSSNSRDRKPGKSGDSGESSKNTSALSPVSRYVIRQHGLLKEAIVYDRTRAFSEAKRPEDGG